MHAKILKNDSPLDAIISVRMILTSSILLPRSEIIDSSDRPLTISASVALPLDVRSLVQAS